VQTLTTASTDILAITGGALTVTTGTSTLSGPLALSGGSLTASGSGVNLTANGSTTASNASLFAVGGATLSLPQLTSYTPTPGADPTLQASGTGSLLSLPAVTTLTADDSNNDHTQISLLALAGAHVDVAAASTLRGAVQLISDGANSQLDASALSSYQGYINVNSGRAYMQVTNGGTILDGTFTGPSVVNLILDGTGTLATHPWTTFASATATITGGTPDFSNLANIQNASFLVSGGAQVTLPAVVTDAAPSTGGTSTLQASGTGSLLSLPAVTTLTADDSNNNHTQVTVQALAGRHVGLPAVITLSGAIDLISDGANSQLDVSAATSFQGYINGIAASAYIQATNGGTLLDGALANLNVVILDLNNGATLSFPALTKGNLAVASGQRITVQGTTIALPASGTSGATVNLPSSQGLTVTLENGGTLTATTFDIGPGTIAALAGGAYTGSTTFNVGQGATADLTGGQTTTFTGTLTSTGAGTVQLGGGTLAVGLGGITLNFPGSVLQWTGGVISTALGDVTNLGTLNLAGSGEKAVYNDGTLDNFGALIQTGSGNLGLHSDNTTATTLKIEPGATYLIESDAGIDNPHGGKTTLSNAGLILKTAGSGISTLSIAGPLSNTGTIEADSGTLQLAPASVSQVSGTTLTGGTWNALNGATLAFPTGTTIATNQASLSLSGSGATIGGLAKSGLTNSGSLTLGAALNVGGNFTQTAGATLNVQLAGTPASQQFGQLLVTGTATLGGAFNATLTSGFGPDAGQDFKVLSYASATGTFAPLNAASPFFTVALNPTSLDLVDNGMNAADLVATSVTAPTTATAGQSITVNWQAADPGSQPIAGNWQDSVYLSSTPTITASSILLDAVPHNGGLSAGGSYPGALTTSLPGLAPGNYYVLVQVDSLNQVPDDNRANNILAASTGPLGIQVPALTVGTPTTGSFTAAGQGQYYQVTVPAGGSLTIALSSAASSGALALYVSAGTPPTPYSFQEAATGANQPNQTVVVPQVLSAGTYNILVESVAGAAATAGYTLTITQSTAPAVSGTTPASGGNAGNVTVEIDGVNFSPTTTASLTLGGTPLAASAIDFVSASQLFATFNLAGAALGAYTLSVQQAGQSITAPTPFQVVAATTGALDITLTTPQFVRSGRTGTVVISYTNSTANDLVAPLLTLSSTNSNVLFSTPDDPNNFVQTAEVLAVAPSGPAGILRPGQSGQLTVTVLSSDPIDNDTIPLQVNQLQAGQPINWTTLQPVLQPSNIPAAAWNVIYANLVAGLGTSTDAYNAVLARAATYLSGLGESTAEVSNVGRLWSFLVAQANASFPTPSLSSAVDALLPTPGSLSLGIESTFVATLAGRYTPGIFGLGWVTSWEDSLSANSSGNVTINSGGALSFFTLQADGSYLDTSGVYGTLTSSGGAFTFTATSGMQQVFLANGHLNYVQDTNGNRITLGYNAQNQLSTLTYANPADTSEPSEVLTLTYNAQGFVSQVTDGTGNTWTYQYDLAGHLLAVAAPGSLTTTYTYDTSSNGETVNALLSITHADGSQQAFTYDAATGRLTGTSQNGGADPLTYSYGGEAEVTTTDAASNQSTVWFNDLGVASRTEDARGSISTYLYDTNGNLVSATDAAGNQYQYTYDQHGNLAQVINPLGQTVQTTVGAFSNLTSITDAAGNTTQYKYSSAGNLLSITYPDATQQSFTYDPLGNLSETVLQNGNPVGNQYNAQGLLTLRSFADGSSQAFTYDPHGNLLTAKSVNAADSVTGTTTLTYNAANALTSITYPNGQHLTFTYDATTGQRRQSVDQDGFAVNYTYDPLGRLFKLTDGSGNLIVQYTYNNLGQLTGKQNGNRTSTTYAYDPAGNLTNIVNYAPDGKTVNSSFAYSYDLLGHETSVTDAAGNVTTYGYDASGQLTQVTLPDKQTITYVYDAAGNRTAVINNGTAINYSSNAANEITQAGATTYTYDANGNLHTATDSSGTTTYTYNDLNQLLSIASPDGSATSFQYSPLGFLVGTSTTTGGTTSQTNYLVDPTGLGNVVGSYNGSGTLIAHYIHGLGLVSQTGSTGTGYYDFNASGNTVGITGASGSYVNKYNYLPFGETTTVAAALPNPFTFVGQFGVMQIGGNLLSMRAREYTPATGQFLSEDPLGLGGGDTNLRRYVLNNPSAFADPLGLQAEVFGPENGGPAPVFNSIDIGAQGAAMYGSNGPSSYSTTGDYSTLSGGSGTYTTQGFVQSNGSFYSVSTGANSGGSGGGGGSGPGGSGGGIPLGAPKSSPKLTPMPGPSIVLPPIAIKFPDLKLPKFVPIPIPIPIPFFIRAVHVCVA
jgi:RHS repeat-associated protein